MLCKMIWPQIEDEQVVRRRELRQLHSEMESLKQIYYRLECEYKEKKLVYCEIDKKRALHDGRLRVVKPSIKPPKPVQEMSQDQVNDLIRELEQLIK